ncbi:MAG: hypothetical protein LQ338_004931 [Usnochroma carphineum]|nr:MAG: hypothetical protein LQ338_004931 [Usnochroma carphineum]
MSSSNETVQANQSATTDSFHFTFQVSSPSSPPSSSKGSAGESDTTAVTDASSVSEGLSNPHLSVKQSTIRRLLDPKAKFPLSGNPKTPTEFKDVIVNYWWCDAAIQGAIWDHELESDDIPVMYHEGKTYSLCPSAYCLNHEPPEGKEEADTGFRQLNYEGQTHSHKGFGSDFFLPLGNLIEPDDKRPAGRLTNYVWALNITTDPVSLWLVYDYVSETELGDKVTTDLSHIYQNVWNLVGIDDADTYACERRALGKGYLGLGREWDVVKVFDDINHWEPETPRSPTFDHLSGFGQSLRAYALTKPTIESLATKHQVDGTQKDLQKLV